MKERIRMRASRISVLTLSMRACAWTCGLAVSSAALFASDIPINILGSTQTQIVINYTATTQAPCTVSAIDQTGPPVNDLNPKIFPSADQDLNRTAANRFRWPTIVNGLARTVIIGGHY